MAGNYDGSIRIDTAINTVPIDSGLSQIENKIKSVGAAIGLAFGVKELIDFGKRSVDAASDLAEAQNVVDTAFGAMSYKMEQFADIALETYGISELTAKNMGSTYMAMAKGMGVAADAASDMAVTLTGRLSDIMSFYNKTQSEVDTIGRALITGETEPLKAIGVVMTQTNLSAYAMAKGFSKNYTEMRANEQLLVRYKYFLEQTSLAQGDFAKTSEGWANQTRLLSERLNEFMTNFGGLIMNTLTPALQFANEAVTFLNDLFFRDKDNAENASAVKSAEAITDEVTSMGTAAEKSEKKLNNLLSGFDELHVISGAKSNSEDETEGAGIDTSDLLGVSLNADTANAKKAAKKYRDIINEIYLAFKNHPLTKTVEGIIKKLGEFFGFFKNDGKINSGGIVTALMDILEAIIAYNSVAGIVKGVSAFSKGFSGLISLATAHPVAAAVVGITALAIGLYKLDQELQHQRLVDAFGDISISLEEIDELIDLITADIDNVGKAFNNSRERLNTARDNFTEVAEAVRKTADAFKNGDMEQNVEGFAKQLDDFVNGALELNSATYDTRALERLFANDGVIDDEEQKILDRFNEFGGTVADRIENIRSQIHEITQGAINENRELLESEIKNIQDLYNQIAEMTVQQEDVKTSATWERLKNGAYTYDSYAELAEQIKTAQEQAEKSRQATEQAAYEDLMVKYNDMKKKGVSGEEIELSKKDDFKVIAEDMKELELQSKRYEREIILAFAQGTFTRMAELYTKDPEQLDIMQKYFELMVSAPKGVDPKQTFSGISAFMGNDINEALYRADAIINNDIKKEFGLDFAAEWERLNDEIGDSVYSVEYFNNAVEDALNSVTAIDLDQILPKVEDFEKRPKEYQRILSEFAAYTEYAIRMNVELDTTEVDEFFNKFAKDVGLDDKVSASQSDLKSEQGNTYELLNKYLNGNSSKSIANSFPSFFGVQMPAGYKSDEQSTELKIKLYNNDEQIVETQMPLGTSKAIEDNGKSSWGGRHR